MRILSLLARHGTDEYADAPAALRAMFARQMPEIRHDLLVIDNAAPPGYRAQEAGVCTIGGDNTAWEFSAWDRGVAAAGPGLDGYDFVHLATSAFRQLYVRYLDRFDADMLGLVRGRAVAVGHLDHHGEPMVLLGRAARCWLRSSFVLLPPLELRLLGPLACLRDGSAFFSGNPAEPFRADAPLSAAYRRSIVGWLTGAGTGQGVAWHSRFALTPQTLPFFEQKALAMLNEQLLTLRLGAAGCRIVDATWLATLADGLLGDRRLGAIPDWRVQLRERDTDPVN